MNIRDIAKAAGVSPSTVSKVLNRRDDSIAPDTRLRVQKVIKEMNYVPFAAYSERQASRLLGVLLRGQGSQQILQGFEETARREGYCPLVCICSSAQEEERSLYLLGSHHVDGLLWMRAGDSLDPEWDAASRRDLPAVLLGPGAPAADTGLMPDRAAMAEAMIRELHSRCHTHIFCVPGPDSETGTEFEAGYRRAMYAAGLQPEEPLSTAEGAFNAARLYNGTAAVCESIAAAESLKRRLSLLGITVPEHFSIVCLHGDGEPEPREPFSSLCYSLETVGANAAARLIGRIEQRELPEQPVSGMRPIGPETLGSPSASRILRVLVVGTLNMDTLLRLPAATSPWRSTSVLSKTVMPGGKALNQAVACKKLGAEVNLIGRLGHDYEGAMIHSFLQTGGISTQGIFMDRTADTGYACITINSDGESTILIDRGANESLTRQDVAARENLFDSVGFCLLQTELSADLALYCAEKAHQHGAKVILKPCNQPRLSNELLAAVDYLIPNDHELDDILPGPGTSAEKARRLLERGARCVIVTLGHEGCLLVTEQEETHFPATKVHVVDTTGACDAFAAALAVFLMRGECLHTAIEYATCAAGLSTEQQGVPPALPDLATVRQFYRNNRLPGKG